MVERPITSADFASKIFLLNPKHQCFLNEGKRHFYDFQSAEAFDNAVMLIYFSLMGIGILNGRYPAVLLIFPYLVIRQLYRNYRLSHDGEIIQGRIMEVDFRPSHYKLKDCQLILRYACLSPTGRVLHRKESLRRNDLKKGGLPEAGDPIMVCYVHDRLFRIL